MKTTLDDLLQKDFIARSSSPFAAPILFVGKKDGSRRLCTDFRALNKITIKNCYPLPRIEDLQDCLYSAKVFSSIDLTSGYWQIPIRAEDQHKTAFRSRYGHYEWKVMPFGLCNAPATFQRFMNDIFRDLLDVCVVVYLDDILVFSNTEEEHRLHLQQVLQRLRDHHLVAKPKKCLLGQPRIEFLGHVIGNGCLEMSSEKVKAIQQWKTPFCSQKEVRAFLGLASYYRRFIRNFAKVAAPISDLLQKDQELFWTTEAEQAVKSLKEAITTAPVLQIADPNKPFTITTDASGIAVGAVLEQEAEDKCMHPVAFTSQKLRPEQRHYEVRDLELLAIVHALKTWRPYLLGQKVRVLTDHIPLESIQRREMDPSLKPRTLRAIEYLQAFDLDIHRVPGSKNVVADALSRYCIDANHVSCVDIDPVFRARIEQEYEHDELFHNVIKRLHNGEQLRGRYRLDQNLLYYTRRGVQRLCIPRVASVINAILGECHDSVLRGHLGVEKTLTLVQRSYYWPNMTEDIRAYVESCKLCQEFKSQNKSPAGLLQPLPIPTKRWESVSMDIVTGLPETAEGYSGCVVFVDRLSKMAHFAAVSSRVDSEQLAQIFINNVFRLHGMPQSIVSDRDPRFMSRFWRAVFDTLESKLLYSSAYHPQTDGQTERMNRTLEQMLRIYTYREPAEWEKRLGAVEFAYNNATQASTRYSPFFLMYGEHPHLPLALSDHKAEFDINVESAQSFMQHFHKVLIRATRALHNARAYQKKQADKHRRELIFNEGDWVMLSTRNISSEQVRAFRKRFIGPYRVSQKLSDVAYRLDLPSKLHIHDVFHVSLLKPHHACPERFVDRRRPERNEGNDEEEVVITETGPARVEKIMGRRERVVANGGIAVEFLVRWCDSSASEDSWEELRNLPPCGRQLREYQRVMRT